MGPWEQAVDCFRPLGRHKKSTRANGLIVDVAGTKRSPYAADRRWERPGSAWRPVCIVQSSTAVHCCADTCRWCYIVWTRPLLDKGSSGVCCAWPRKRCHMRLLRNLASKSNSIIIIIIMSCWMSYNCLLKCIRQIIHSIHWLPYPARVEFKLCSTIYQARQD